jgi:hypothetical protein
MMSRRIFTAALAAASMGTLEAATGTLMPRLARAENGSAALVHGLFADGSCWSEVIARLQAAERDFRTEPADNVGRRGCGDAARAGPAGRTERAGGTFLLRHDR